ncbi:MAG: sodium/solute symporter, partial [Segetibacter sp.]|nr:sodium/solute symporter [Segetibacter sp.]
DYPFLDRMGITFLVIAGLMIVMSLVKPKPANDTHVIEVDKSLFRVSPDFVVGSIIIVGVLVALYTVFW